MIPAELVALPLAEAELLDASTLRAVIAEADTAGAAVPPALLLLYARACEPGQLLAERTAALRRVDGLLAGPGPDPALAALQRFEVAAERAIDEARQVHLDAAEPVARAVLAGVERVRSTPAGAEPAGVAPAGPARTSDATRSAARARARATEALGRVLAWRGDERSRREADGVLADAAEQYRALGSAEWEGFARFWRAWSVTQQSGDPDGAEAAMRAALELLSPATPRRCVVLTFYADVLTRRGRWDDAGAALDEATALAARRPEHQPAAYAAWSRARLASQRGDAAGTVRALAECERYPGDWFATSSGTTLLADAAEMADRVGERAAADDYLRRAEDREPDDEFVLQARAALAARRGDPDEALRQLRAMTRAPWIESHMAWRHSLLAAYATMRARRPGFGPLAARALDQAVAVGGVEVALAGEAALVRALAPAAAAAGSAVAASILAPGTGLTLQLLGEVRLARHGETVPVPAGTAGALLRVLGPHRAGLDIDQIVDALRPDLDAPTGRRLVSRAASRLRSLTGVPVERHGTRLRLVGVWVDAVAFRDAADRALAGAGGLDPDPAAEAIALWSGELLPSDPYADWAAPERQRLRRRYLALLDLLAADAAGRKSLDEAARLLEEAIEVDPDDEGRYLELARCHLAADRRVPARRALERARRALLGLGLGPSGELLGLEAATDGDGPDRPGPG